MTFLTKNVNSKYWKTKIQHNATKHGKTQQAWRVETNGNLVLLVELLQNENRLNDICFKKCIIRGKSVLLIQFDGAKSVWLFC